VKCSFSTAMSARVSACWNILDFTGGHTGDMASLKRGSVCVGLSLQQDAEAECDIPDRIAYCRPFTRSMLVWHGSAFVSVRVSVCYKFTSRYCIRNGWTNRDAFFHMFFKIGYLRRIAKVKGTSLWTSVISPRHVDHHNVLST